MSIVPKEHFFFCHWEGCSFYVMQGVPLSFCHCEEYRKTPFPLSLRGVPKARRSNLHTTSSLRGRTKSFRSNLIAWFPHARLSLMFVIARKDASPDEAISLLVYFWNSHTIVNQLPEIASDAMRPRNDKHAGVLLPQRLPRALHALAMTEGEDVIARSAAGTTKQSLTEYSWKCHTIALQGPEIATSLRSSQ